MDPTRQNQVNGTALDGEQLSVQYCSACHQYPKPELLNKSTWRNYVLPRMGYMMGIYPSAGTRDSLIEKNEGGLRVLQTKVFPEQPLLEKVKWEKIANYYWQNAPIHLPETNEDTIMQPLPHFKVIQPQYRISPPSTTLVQMNETGIFIGDAHTKKLYQFDSNLKLINAANVREGAVSMDKMQDQILVTSMGSFSPTDAPTGLLFSLPTDTHQKPKILLKDLQRPVHASYADLNGDGLVDIVVCEFAKWTGCLAWWENKGNDTYQKHVLRNKPGATRAYIQDMNDDHQPDIIALFGQGDEGFFIYYNEGNGRFREERFLQFPPSYGSSYFDIIDFNKDGFSDIIYTAGDNADYPPLKKPYHGIRVFLNDGHNNFSEELFFPLPGAYKAIPRDFDLDGDTDFAAISFFPDFAHAPEKGFVFFENQGNNTFQCHTFLEATLGRWLVMDIGDQDKDGDLDIILGSLAFEVIPDNGLVQQWVNDGIPFLILENMVK